MLFTISSLSLAKQATNDYNPTALFRSVSLRIEDILPRKAFNNQKIAEKFKDVNYQKLRAHEIEII